MISLMVVMVAILSIVMLLSLIFLLICAIFLSMISTAILLGTLLMDGSESIVSIAHFEANCLKR